MDFNKKYKSIKDTLSYEKYSFNNEENTTLLKRKSPFGHKKSIIDNTFGETIKGLPPGSGIGGPGTGESPSIGPQGSGTAGGSGTGGGSTGGGSSTGGGYTQWFEWSDFFWPDSGGGIAPDTRIGGSGSGGGGGGKSDSSGEPSLQDPEIIPGRKRKKEEKDRRTPDDKTPEDYLKQTISNWDELTDEQKKALLEFFNKVGRAFFDELIKYGKKVKINFMSQDKLNQLRRTQTGDNDPNILGWFDGYEIYLANEILDPNILKDYIYETVGGTPRPVMRWEIIAHEFAHLIGILRFGDEYAFASKEDQENFAIDFVNDILRKLGFKKEDFRAPYKP